ncbi:MAG TPA: hypothetical protein VN259_10000 [Xanthomonadales bacterium]|nr:hypothetical protein [Xanthomonadales bacterium]
MFDYTVLDKELNRAARLEPLNKACGTRIMVAEATCRAAGRLGRCLAADREVLRAEQRLNARGAHTDGLRCKFLLGALHTECRVPQ